MSLRRLYPYALVIAAFTALLGAAALSHKEINTYAGDGTAGYSGDGGSATSANLDTPYGIAVADNGDVYIADSVNEVIRKVDFITGNISTVAGGSTVNGDGLAATSAFANKPQAVVVNASGDIFIASTMEHRIRKVTNATGIISTVGGDGTAGYSGDGGTATSAQINAPAGIALDSGGNVIFSDTTNSRIRKITPGGVISTIAGTGTAGYSGDGGSATIAEISTPHGIFIDSADNIYFVDRGNHVIRKFTDGGNISTIAGIGTSGYTGDYDYALLAEFDTSRGLWIEENGDGYSSFSAMGFNTIFGSTESNVKQQQIATQVTLATDGTVGAITAYIQSPAKGKDVRYAIYTDVAGEPDTLVAETAKVKHFDGPAWFTLSLPKTAITSGTYWLALAFADDAQFNTYDAAGGQTRYVANDAAKDGYLATWGTSDTSNTRRLSIYARVLDSATGTIVYVADTNNSVVRKFLEGGLIETVAGSAKSGFGGDGGAATSAKLKLPEDVALDSTGNILIGDTQNHLIRKVDAATGIIETYGGTRTAGYSGDGGAATSADMDWPTGLFVDGSDDLFLADTNNHVIRKIADATGIITVVAGTPGEASAPSDGLDATLAYLGVVEDVAIDSSNNLYIAATQQARIRKVDGSTGIITTIAGTGVPGYSGDAGLATLAQIQTPRGVTIDDSDNIYIADTDNHVIRKFLEGGVITTVAGDGTAGNSGDGGLATAAQLKNPRGVDVDSDGNIYIADTENHRVRKVDEFTGIIDTIAGTGGKGYSGDGGLATLAELKKPYSLQIDDDGNLYIADTQNSAIRMVDTAGIIDTIAGTGKKGYSGDGGPANSAQFDNPGGLGFNLTGSDYLYISDTVNNRVRYFRISGVTIVSWQEIEP